MEEIGKAQLDVLQDLRDFLTKERDYSINRRNIFIEGNRYQEAAQQNSEAVGLDMAIAKIHLTQLRISKETYREANNDKKS